MHTENPDKFTRRKFILAGAALASGLPLTSCQTKREEQIGPVEDLMREHGVLRRVLLIYEEFQRRIAANILPAPALVTAAVGIIKGFIEDYHERLEDEFIFGPFIRAGKETSLVNTLVAQHKAGRAVTARIGELAGAITDADRKELSDNIGKFIRVYRPHAAWEDTVLFPAFRGVVSPSEFNKLGETFEEIEIKSFGKNGFELMVAKVAEIEKELGIYDLAQFTPS
jgi:hemerythrin-like domain-containing protein